MAPSCECETAQLRLVRAKKMEYYNVLGSVRTNGPDHADRANRP